MKKHILIASGGLKVGGVERTLIEYLNNIDKGKVYLNNKTKNIVYGPSFITDLAKYKYENSKKQKENNQKQYF